MSNEVFEAVLTRLIEDDALAELFEDFARNNCDVFVDDEEQKLEYTKIYEDFQKLFEEKFGEILAAESMSVDEFYAACQQGVEDGGDGAEVVEFLLALTDYDMFVHTMREAARNKRETGA